MKKNLIIISFIICIILLTISITSAIEVNKNQSIENKESPLYKIRTRQVLGNRLKELIECIKARFLGERMFFLPFHWILENIKLKDNTYNGPTSHGYPTCDKPSYIVCFS